MGGHAEGVLCTYQVVKVEMYTQVIGYLVYLCVRVLYLAVPVECRD